MGHGFGPRISSWLNSYFEERYLQVKVNESLSAPSLCTSGVPQGIILGPKLWNYFLADLATALPRGVGYKFYADDLKLYSAIVTVEGSALLQQACDAVYRWALLNEMELSAGKCSVMRSKGSAFLTQYFVGPQVLPEVRTVKDLGVIFQHDLGFGHQLAATALKCSRIGALIMRCFANKNVDHYMRMFHPLIMPIMLYACEVWRSFKQKEIALLEKIRRRFIKSVSFRCSVQREVLDGNISSIQDIFVDRDKLLFTELIASGRHESFLHLLRITGAPEYSVFLWPPHQILMFLIYFLNRILRN